MQRYFIEPGQFGDETIKVTGEDVHHISKVMRLKPSDKFIVSDGISKEAIVEITAIEAHEVTASILEMTLGTSEPRIQVTVAQSLPKGDKMETVIQKCTEIGAISFYPFYQNVLLFSMITRKKRNARYAGARLLKRPLNKRIAVKFQWWNHQLEKIIIYHAGL